MLEIQKHFRLDREAERAIQKIRKYYSLNTDNSAVLLAIKQHARGLPE